MPVIIEPSNRLSTTEEYYFSRKLKEIARLNQSGEQVINLGIGSPDMMPDEVVIKELANNISRSDVHGYQPYQGLPELRKAITEFSKKHYHSSLSDSEILPLIGSKEGIMHISWSYLNSGDQVIIPALGYPTYSSVTRLAGGEPIYFPLIEEDQWNPDWDFLEQLDYSKVKLMWINYPHMPTGARGSVEILERYIDLAHRKKFLLCHDNPYSFILTEKPFSMLSIDGAMEVGIELNSFSKSHNMAGWRIGWVAGTKDHLQPVLKMKSNMDSGMFMPLQLAAIEALKLDEHWFGSVNQVYQERKEVVHQMLDQLDCSYSNNQSGLFVWARVPGGDGSTFSDEILSKNKIFITPGEIFGAQGKDFIRVSLCTPVDVLQQALSRIAG